MARKTVVLVLVVLVAVVLVSHLRQPTLAQSGIAMKLTPKRICISLALGDHGGEVRCWEVTSDTDFVAKVKRGDAVTVHYRGTQAVLVEKS
jgi:hypothetical protein